MHLPYSITKSHSKIKPLNQKMAKKLLEQLREILRMKHYSYRTAEAYMDWVRRFILFHNKRHPAEMGAPEIRAFLAHLAQERNIPRPPKIGP